MRKYNNFILNKTNPILIKAANKRAQETDFNPLETNGISQKKLRYNNLDKVLIRLKFDCSRIDSAFGYTRIHLKRVDSFILREW